MPPQSFDQKKPTQYWKWFLPPMLLLSLGLHGLVLFTPVAPSEDDLVPPPDPEEDGIAITKIDPPRARATTPQSNTGTVKTAPSNPSPTPSPTATAATPQSQANQQSSRTGSNSSDRRPNSSRSNSNSARPATTDTGSQPANASQGDVPDLSAAPTVNVPNPPAPAVTPPTSDPFEEYIEVFKSFRGQTATEEEITTLKGTWLSGVTERGAAYANLEIQPLKNLETVPYEAKICLPEAPTSAQVLVLVEADGNLDSDRQLVRTTGYRSFNRAVQELVQQHDYPEAETPQAFLVEIEVDYDESNCQPPQDVANLPDEYFAILDDYIGPELTTIAEANMAKTEWFMSLSESGEIEFSEAEALEETATLEGFDAEVEYALGICLPIAPQEAWWGVLVNPDGTVNGEPNLLRSTGYGGFDDRSQELVRAFDFPEVDTPQAYVIEVPVGYNSVNCEQPAQKAAEAGESTTSNPDSTDSPEQAAQSSGAFDPTKQAQLATTGRQNVDRDALVSLNSDDPGLVTTIVDSGWPDEVDKGCFLSEHDPETGLVPADGAEDVVVLSQNADRAPATIGNLYGVTPNEVGEYCSAPLYELQENGTPQLFASVVGFGTGNSSALVVIWFSDPRQA
ncbi:MAG: hypothetical protein F6J95_003645 [Leptolyngbya sp. SIO1E4]|nr:hypothetical protein [Leptolyngbya sp. SIO1E4]